MCRQDFFKLEEVRERFQKSCLHIAIVVRLFSKNNMNTFLEK